MLEAHGPTRRFGELTAVDTLTISVDAGEVFSLLGANGAGKTLALKILTTLLRPSAGNARVAGFDIVHHTARLRRCIGYVPQLISADGALTGYENLPIFAKRHDIPRAERIYRGRVEKEHRRTARHRLGELELADHASGILAHELARHVSQVHERERVLGGNARRRGARGAEAPRSHRAPDAGDPACWCSVGCSRGRRRFRRAGCRTWTSRHGCSLQPRNCEDPNHAWGGR